MSSVIEIEISDTQGHLRVDPSALKQLAQTTLVALGRAHASISIVLVDNATIHRINREHLEHDWPTDVITFPLNEPGEPALIGELVISTEMARETAIENGGEPDRELALYVVHGILHLCGFDDHSDLDRARMRAMEETLLSQLVPLSLTSVPPPSRHRFQDTEMVPERPVVPSSAMAHVVPNSEDPPWTG
jgi:probable rRNA maturation factor